MEQQLDRIEQKIDKLMEHNMSTVQRLSKLEANQRGFIAAALIITTTVGALLVEILGDKI